jgi:hypothetical protein
VKKTFFAAALAITLSLSAAAATKKPAMHLNPAGDPSAKHQPLKSRAPQPPAACSPCLFYGGDLNPTDPNADGFSDENTLLIVGGSQTYGAVSIPSGPNANVTGILVNVLATAAFDPFTAVYDIRQGVSEGNGGTDISTGSGSVSVTATGRIAFGLYEYTVAVSFPAVTLAPGEYWFNAQPQCTNTLDGSCNVFRQYASNTTQETNAVNGDWQPTGEMFLISPYFEGFGYPAWSNWCDASFGTTSGQCADLSFGLVGTN